MAKITIKGGKPGKKFIRLVLPNKFATIPKRIELFEFDKKGEVTIEDEKLYGFEMKRILRKYSVYDKDGKQINAPETKEEPKKEEDPSATGRGRKKKEEDPSKKSTPESGDNPGTNEGAKH